MFVVYAFAKKGYKCWDPIGRKLFMSMDVRFHDEEPYYTNKGDLDQFLKDFCPVTVRDHREGEDNGGEGGDLANGAPGEVIVGGVVPHKIWRR
jgi:hypothetical protein